MLARPLLLLALGAIASMSAATPAAAGACCACPVPCVVPAPVAPARVYVRPAHVKPSHYVKPVYVVNQGPVYGGPSIVTRPAVEAFNRPLAAYPYVTNVSNYSSDDADPVPRYYRYRSYKWSD
jgi:hypothetical protein